MIKLKTSVFKARPGSLAAAAAAAAFIGQVLMYFFKLAAPGLLFFAAAAWLLLLYDKKTGKPAGFKIPIRTEILLFAGIMITAVLFRTAFLNDVPSGCFSDEADQGLFAKKILEQGLPDGNLLPIVLSGQTYHPCLTVYPAAALFRFFGTGITQLRLASAVLGVLAVPAFYFLIRGFIGVLPALAGAFLLASMRWHVNFSRIGMDAVLASTLALLSAYFIALAYKRRTPLDFVMAGFSVAASQYTYVPCRLIFAWLMLLAVYAAVKDRKFFVENARKIILALVTAAVFLAPLAGYYLKKPSELLKRTQQVFIFDRSVVDLYWGPQKSIAAAAAETALKTFGMFNLEGDKNGRHNLPGMPMLDFLTGMAAAAGFIYSLRYLSRPGDFFFISFFAVFLLPGLISIEAPQALRTIIAAPAVIFFAVVFIDKLASAARIKPAYAATALALFLLAAASLNAYAYFGQQARDARCGRAFYEDQYQTVKFLSGVKKGERIIAYKNLFLYNQVFYFIAGSREKEYRVFDPNEPFLAARPGEKGVVYVLPRNYRPVADVLMGVYPNAQRHEGRNPYSGHEFVFTDIFVPEMDLMNWDSEGKEHGLNAKFYDKPGWKGKTVLTEKKQLIVYDWLKQPVMAPSSAEWTGRLKIEKPGVYVFAVQSRDYADLYIDGKKVAVNKGLDTLDEKTTAAEGEITLNTGFHGIRLRQDVKRYYLRLNLWWRPPGEIKNGLVPPGVLYYNDGGF